MDPRYPPAAAPNPAPVKEPSRRGRRKINIEYIPDKSRRQITFSKRKAGIMKKAYELATLTGTQVLLLVASESGHVYTFATPKLQPLITEQEGKNLIQNCLNAPAANSEPDNIHEQDSPPNSSLNIHSYAHKRELEEDDDEEDETVLRTPLKTEQKIPEYAPQNNYPPLGNSAFTPGNFLNQPLYGGRPGMPPSHSGISPSNPHSANNPYLPPSHALNPPFNPYGYPSQPPPYGPSNSASSSGYLMRPPSGMMLNPALDMIHPSSHASLQGHNGQLDDEEDEDDDGEDD